MQKRIFDAVHVYAQPAAGTKYMYYMAQIEEDTTPKTHSKRLPETLMIGRDSSAKLSVLRERIIIMRSAVRTTKKRVVDQTLVGGLVGLWIVDAVRAARRSQF